MAKPTEIELPEAGLAIPILYEDRSVMALDKPAGWLLAPDNWDRTARNLQLALHSSLNAGEFWARSRNLKFLRYVHRLDAETTGVILFARSQGALESYTELFETRRVDKYYMAVVRGRPQSATWTCQLPLMADPDGTHRMRVAPSGTAPRPARPDDRDEMGGEDEGGSPETTFLKDAETHFRVIAEAADTTLVEAHPVTGRTHQIRVHLAAAGHPVVGDPIYGTDPAAASKGRQRLALRAWRLGYRDPFQRRPVRIEAPMAEFLREYGFSPKLATGVPARPRPELPT